MKETIRKQAGPGQTHGFISVNCCKCQGMCTLNQPNTAHVRGINADEDNECIGGDHN